MSVPHSMTWKFLARGLEAKNRSQAVLVILHSPCQFAFDLAQLKHYHTFAAFNDGVNTCRLSL